MRSPMFRLIAYLRYLNKSGTRHSVHSPFVYKLIEDVLRNSTMHPAFSKINALRKSLLNKTQVIEITDFGSGANKKEYVHRFEHVSSIAHKSSVSQKFGQMLHRLVACYNPKTILELGTSLGISTLYMATAAPGAQVFTVEGCTTKSEQAEANFAALQTGNIDLHIGKFDIVLPGLLQKIQKLDFAFIDGNHTCEGTLSNFETLLPFMHNETILVFDDIHWSAGMEEAWNKITFHPKVTVTIDLFQMGIVFFRKELSKQNFVLRF